MCRARNGSDQLASYRYFAYSERFALSVKRKPRNKTTNSAQKRGSAHLEEPPAGAGHTAPAGIAPAPAAAPTAAPVAAPAATNTTTGRGGGGGCGGSGDHGDDSEVALLPPLDGA